MRNQIFQTTLKYRKPMSFFILGVIITAYLFFNYQNQEIVLPPELLKKNCILFYDPPDWMVPLQGPDAWNFSACKFSDCRLTTIKSEISRSKYAIFYHGAMPYFPPIKKSFQKWIFTSMENPYNTDSSSRSWWWKSSFDMIMSYRRDSDFFTGYGNIIPRKEPIGKDYDAIFSKKDKDIAWIVSHCETHSQREKYVQEMQEVIDIDIIGQCGNISCDTFTGDYNDTCHNAIGKKYKFYLSFENGLCKDYTTEKLYFVYELNYDIIPVVHGAFNSKEYLPKEGVIYTNDFKSPKHLARYLQEVGSDKERYIQLLRQKDHYTSRSFLEMLKESLCLMCKNLSLWNPHQYRKSFDIENWWWHGACREPSDL